MQFGIQFSENRILPVQELQRGPVELVLRLLRRGYWPDGIILVR